MKILKQHAAVKSIGGIVLLLLVFFAIVSIIGYNSFTEALMSQYSEGAFLTAETAAQMIDADRMDEFMRETFGERYMGGLSPTSEGLRAFAEANPSLLTPEPLPIYLNPAVRA